MKFLSNLLIKAGLIVEGSAELNAATNTIYAGTGTRLRTEANNLVFERVASSGVMKLVLAQGTLGPTAKAYLGYSNATLNVILSNEHASGALELRTSDIIRQQIFANGNVVIGQSSPVDAGFRLDVNGNTRITGSGNTSASTALTVNNSSSTNLLSVRNDGLTTLGGNLSMPNVSNITSGNNSISFEAGRMLFNTTFNLITNQFAYNFSAGGGFTNSTSGASGRMRIEGLFSPLSGTATYAVTSISAEINQQGGANGITRGLLINATLTSAADWRSIETSNNTGWSYYGAGTAPSFFGGSVTGASFIRTGGTSTQYLMADGTTSTLTNPVTGTGVAGQVAYWSGTNTQTGSNNLFWDNANARLGILGNTPIAPLTIFNAGDNNRSSVLLQSSEGTFRIGFRQGVAGLNTLVGELGLEWNDTKNTAIKFYRGGGTTGGFLAFTTNNDNERLRLTSAGNMGLGTTTPDNSANYSTFTINGTTGGQITLKSSETTIGSLYNTSTDVGLATNGVRNLLFVTNNLERGRFFGTGNFGINTGATDSGQRLQVIGDTLMRGSGNTSATTALRVQNSDTFDLFTVLNNGYTRYGNLSNSAFRVYSSSVGSSGDVDLFGEFLTLNSRSGSTQTGTAAGFVHINGIVSNGTSGIQNVLCIQKGFAPTSGNAEYRTLISNPVINQTGGANGITRGLLVNPTLTAAADWRSIEWSNNTGWGMYGAGTSNNYLNGSLAIGNTTVSTFGNGGITLGSTTNGKSLVLTSSIAGENGLIQFIDSSASNAFQIAATASNISLFGYGSRPMIFWTNGSERGRIFANGNFGINTGATDSGERLQVTGTMKVTGASTFGGNMSLTLDQNAPTVLTITNLSTLAAAQSRIVLAGTNGSAIIGKTNTNYAPSKTVSANDTYLYNFSAGNITILNDFASGNINFAAGGSSTAHMTIASTGAATFSSSVTGASFIPTSSTIPTNGMYLSAANTLGFATNGTLDMVINPNGNVGIGTTSLTNRALAIAKTMSGSVDGYGILQFNTISSGVTTSATNNYSQFATQAASFTLANAYHYFNADISVGAGSTITNQYGYFVSAIQAATNNFGFYGNLSSGTGRWNLFMNGSALNYLNGGLLIGSTTNTGEALQVTGDTRMTGELLLSSSVTSIVNGDFSANLSKVYTPTAGTSNVNSYGLVSSVSYNLTSGAYSGAESFNATAFLSQAVIGGNAATKSTQPFRANIAGLVGISGAAAMNISDYRFYDVKSPDAAGVSGHVVDNIYGLKIATLKGSSNYTITNGWGIYQEGSSDNNYFGGKVLVGTNTAGSSPMRISGLPTSSAGLSAGDLWNNGGVINVA